MVRACNDGHETCQLERVAYVSRLTIKANIKREPKSVYRQSGSIWGQTFDIISFDVFYGDAVLYSRVDYTHEIKINVKVKSADYNSSLFIATINNSCFVAGKLPANLRFSCLGKSNWFLFLLGMILIRL